MINIFKWCGLLLVGVFAGAGQAFAILPIQHWQTSTGARVYFVESHQLPMLDVSIDFAAGSSRDTPAVSGLANLTRHMLSLGAGGLSEDEIAEMLADVGAELGGRIDQDRAGVTLRTLSSKRERDQALDMLSRIVQRPEFPEQVLDREKARIVAVLKDSATRPESIADRAFYSLLYGSHPYALRISGEVDSVEPLKRDDLEKFYRTYYTAHNAVVAIIGDVGRKSAQEIAENLTSKLPRDASPLPALPEVTAPLQAQDREVPHPATQSHILLGYPALKRIDPDYFALYVGNYILGGGGFASRFVEQVRQKRGLVYSVYSYFDPLQQKGPFQIGLQTKKEQAQEALKVVRETLRNFIANGPTEQELKAAKQNLVGGFPLRIDSNKKILEYLSIIGFYRLPLTYLDDFVPNVEKVTVAQIKSAFQRRIDPDNMVTVIVGAPGAS
ncbi:MAG TPA: pitrilysin family protein [Burkholderiales bacterium]|nr:pitrilysin family protein [Burkholderiales bacterium]